MKRRLTAVLLILAMLMGLFPMQALAEDNTPTSAQSIFLSQSQVQLQVGEQIRLTAEVIPESAAATAVWVSQDESIATVDNGVITAVASGNTTVSLEVGSLKALCSVTVVSKLRNASQDDMITVFFSILGDSKHGNNGETHTLVDGNLTVWLEQSAYTVSAQATVKDVFLAAVKGKEYSYEIRDGVYLATVNELSEFSNGPRSGWKYLLNGSYPNESIAAQQVRQGDAIVLHYTDDYTKDDNKKIGTDAIEPVIRKISSLEEVTIANETAILAARKAYNALSTGQKLAVGNYILLTEAEVTLTEKIYQQTGDYLATKATPGVGSVNGEWRAIGLERSGRKVTDGYYKKVVEYVLAHINEKERLDAAKSTENSRVILALTAMGYDVTNVAGHNLLAGLNEMSYIQTQGINGPIWALIALNSHDYKPTGDVTREKLISSILAAQLRDGGWALSGNASEPDVTAMALQALAPYYRTRSDVEIAVESALNYLSEAQSPDGGYGIGGDATCESAAQVVVTLTALGFDPDTDSRFVKNGVSVLDAMCTYVVDGSGFTHISGGTIDDMATEQGYYALTAYFRMKAGKTSLYDMSDVTIAPNHYKIIAGGDGKWNTDVQTYTIESDGVFAEFTGIKVDGTLIDSSNYTAKAGSTYVTFENSYLKTLSLGRHSITLVFESCEVTTSLTVTKSDAELVRDVEALIDAIGTVTKSSKAQIDAARNAYNALTAEQQKLVTNYNKLTTAEKAYADLADKITVYFTLLGDTAHGDNGQEHTLTGGNLTTWISRTAYTLESPATVLDVFTKAVSGKYSYVNKGNYISSVNGLAEFTNGKNSGWMYTLNGRHPNLGVAEQKLSNGDSVVFHYTDNYTKERGSGTTGNQTMGKTTNGFLTALAEDQSYANVYQTTGDYLEALGTPAVGTIGGEWMVIGLARSGRKVPEGYYDSVVKYVTENIDANERLHSNKSTDNARLILALTAIEKDVTDVAGHNLLLGLNDMHYLQKQGINGPIWTLIALDCGNYPAPTGGDVSREALIQVILDAQLGDGGWALSGENADPDMTGMALQALAPYYDRNTSVQAAVDHAVTLLSEIQDSDGCYSGVDGASCESLAQVVVALTALDIDPDTDTRFIKNGVSVLDALLRYAVSDGGFRHVLTGQRDGMATEQGYYALTAYNRFLSDKTSLYDMTDVINRGGDPVVIPEETAVHTTTEPVETVPAKSGGFHWLAMVLVLVIVSGAGVLTVTVIIPKFKKKD